ncbi:MAG: hypothetical protein JSU98_13080, partial [Gemmatimonadales bacterium]
SITGYPWAGDVYHDYATRGNPERGGSPLFGHGPDFGYFYLGAIWYGDELWDGGRVGDVNGDGEEDELDRLAWQDSVAAGRDHPMPFREWTPFQHPERGEVEIGGWHPKFFSQNGPPEVLERWARNQALFNLYLAQSLPHLRAQEPRVRRLHAEGDSVTWEVTVPVRNEGRLPTALRQAELVKMVRPDRVELHLEGLSTGGEDPEVRWLEGSERGRVELGYLQPGERVEAVLTFRTYGVEEFRGTFELLSTRGGVLRGEVEGGDRARARVETGGTTLP